MLQPAVSTPGRWVGEQMAIELPVEVLCEKPGIGDLVRIINCQIETAA